MPIYEYRCTQCGHRTDILHGINQPGPNFCPECGAEATMRKTISAPSVHFRGSGWAKKDRATATKTKAAAKSDAAAKPSDGDSKSDAGSRSDSDSKSDGSPTPAPAPVTKVSPAASADGD